MISVSALAVTDAALASSISGSVTQITNSFGSILSWWFVPAVIAIFGASIAIGLVLKFFNKRRGGRRR